MSPSVASTRRFASFAQPYLGGLGQMKVNTGSTFHWIGEKMILNAGTKP
jgi:hypothetical protein